MPSEVGTSTERFLELTVRLGFLSRDQATDALRQSALEGMSPQSWALQRGLFDSTDSEIVQSLLEPQSSIPGYQILDLIGRGGMGVVYRAKQLSLNREVALKTILLNQVANSTATARFENEAQVLARLTHPHIVAAFDLGRHAGRLFLAMELVQGKDVDRLIQHRGRLPEWFVWHVIRQAAAGLAHAARADVIHRDIKPANLLLVRPPDGFALPNGMPMVKIADFGLSILGIDQQTPSSRLTSATMHVGSPAYMAPEQLEGGSIGHAADIFSLGATAWHMIAGHAPLQGSNLRQIVVSRLTQPTPALNTRFDNVSSATSELVSEMVRIEVVDRIADYETLLNRIDSVLDQLANSPSTADATTRTEVDDFDTEQFLQSTPSSVSTAQAQTELFTLSPDVEHTTTFTLASDTRLSIGGVNEVSRIDQTDATHQSNRLARRSNLALLGLGVSGLLGWACWSFFATEPLPVHPQIGTGPRLALFDGNTLAGWNIASGSWFPATDEEGAAVLQGSSGVIRSSRFASSIETFSDYFVLEAICQLSPEGEAQIAVYGILVDDQTFSLKVELRNEPSGNICSVSGQDDDDPPERVARATWPMASDQRPARVAVRLERHQDRWWVLLDGRAIGTATSKALEKLSSFELSARQGITQFADLGVAPLQPLKNAN